LAPKSDLSLSQFRAQTFLIGRFQQAGPKMAVNGYRQPDNALAETGLVGKAHGLFFVAFVSSW
jgi:hypothetical protein